LPRAPRCFPTRRSSDLLSALFEALPALYYALRWAGAAYLLYLAYKAFRDRSDPLAAGGPDAAPAAPARMRAFWQGAVTNLLNPQDRKSTRLNSSHLKNS